MPSGHGPIEVMTRADCEAYLERPSMPSGHGPIEVCRKPVHASVAEWPSMPSGHGPIEAVAWIRGLAICLEEMLGLPVPRGAIFHIKTKRRREVEFTQTLRSKTEAAARRLHELIDAGVTPPPIPKPQCDGCSLVEVCLPKVLVKTNTVSDYVESLWTVSSETDRDHLSDVE